MLYKHTQLRFLPLNYTHSVISEGTNLGDRLNCPFGTLGGFQVKVVVEVSHSKSRLQESTGSFIILSWPLEDFTKGLRIHPLRAMNVHFRFHSNPCRNCKCHRTTLLTGCDKVNNLMYSYFALFKSSSSSGKPILALSTHFPMDVKTSWTSYPITTPSFFHFKNLLLV